MQIEPQVASFVSTVFYFLFLTSGRKGFELRFSLLEESSNTYLYLYISKSFSIAFIGAMPLLSHICGHIIYLFPTISLHYFKP